MWDQKDCDGYIKTAAVLAAYVDQSISTNTFYSPRHFPDRKVPSTLIAKNLMQAHYYGIKTFYYSLVSKQGSKAPDEEKVNGYHIEQTKFEIEVLEDGDEDCLACKL
jgi:ribonucleotide reductase alpha subunit